MAAPAQAKKRRQQSKASGKSGRSSRQTRRTKEQRPLSNWSIPWSMPNFIGIGIGVAVIVLGYILMATAIPESAANNDGIWNNANATTIAPILLTLGYCVIIPVAIFYRPKSDQEMSDMVVDGNGAVE